jgi:dihydrodipicolinate synthase/N-acetylneuraminate lyase
MPYYVYAVKPFAQLARLAEFAAFKDASTHAKSLRTAPQTDAATRIKVMFAENPLAAEDLLLQVRPPGPSGDE